MPSTTASIRVYGLIRYASGTAWFDCIQFEEGNCANNFNALQNSDFSSNDNWLTEENKSISANKGTVTIGGTAGAFDDENADSSSDDSTDETQPSTYTKTVTETEPNDSITTYDDYGNAIKSEQGYVTRTVKKTYEVEENETTEEVTSPSDTDNSADDDSDTSSYDNSLGNKYIYQNIKVGRAGVSFKINGTAKSNSVPLSNENRTFGIALNIYYNNSSTPEFHYQNFSANTDGYQQVSLSVTPEKTNEVVNYIAFAFVYGYNENEMTVDNAEVNISPLIQSSDDSQSESKEKETVAEEVVSESIDKTKPYMQTSSVYDSTGNYVTSETNEQGSTTHYVYDANGNITEIKQNGKLTNKYVYDSLNELKEEYDYVNKFYINYSYDGAGNLQNKYEQALDPNYGYPTGTQNGNTYEYTDTSWKDKLTKINGDNITYDANGNPLTYRDGMSMTWKNGRQLATLTNGDTSISYGYDSDSVRTTKTVNGVKYTYAYLNGQLLYETRGDAKFYYSYDANGILYNVRYTLTDGGTEYSYYYTHNSRGDIVGIYNGVGELKAHYEYDAWGNVISITDNNGNAITNPNHIGNLNPFRYRGYYQDTETGLYYLMSRYYDAVTHRFINADGYFQSGTSILEANTFAYCGNNPTSFSDSTGTFFLESVVFGFGAGLICNVAGQLLSGVGFSNIDWGSAVISGLTGAVLVKGKTFSFH